MARKPKLRLTSDQYAEFYSLLCDIMFKMDTGWPEDGFWHTSKTARAMACTITDRLEAEGWLQEQER